MSLFDALSTIWTHDPQEAVIAAVGLLAASAALIYIAASMARQIIE